MARNEDPANQRPAPQPRDHTAAYGCLGAVLAAAVSGIFLLLSSGTISFDFGSVRIGKASSTPTQQAVELPTASATTPALVLVPTVTREPPTFTPPPVLPTEPPTFTAQPPEPSLSPTAATSTGASEAPLVTGQPAEQDGLLLVVTRLAVPAAGGAGAVQVSFRLINKVGQKLLVPINYDAIHAEDSLGNRYVDWQGSGNTSISLEAGRYYDFSRYYSLQPRDRSHVPIGAAYVDVVVEQLSRVANARWRYTINATLVPAPTPDPSSVKAVGEGWEQDGLTLTVTKVDITAQANSAPAVRVTFSLANHAGQPRLLEIDLSQVYVLDSFELRYGDWQGPRARS